jgi:hypothetical protein
MNTQGIKAALVEAEKFITKAKVLLADGDDWALCGTKDSGALRRQSLELTRSLAEMRKP